MKKNLSKWLMWLISLPKIVLYKLLWFFDLERPNGGLSHSKLFSLITICILIYVCIYDLDNIAAVIAAVAGNLASTANYIHRRIDHAKRDVKDGVDNPDG